MWNIELILRTNKLVGSTVYKISIKPILLDKIKKGRKVIWKTVVILITDIKKTD